MRTSLNAGIADPQVDLVAVDGGASGCRLAAFDECGRRVAEIAIDAHASLTLDEAEAWTTIRTGIARLADTLTRREGETASAPIAGDPATWLPSVLGLGLAGSLQGAHRIRFLERVERETDGAVCCRLVTDGHAQLVGASLGRPAVCLAVGTGSVVHWSDAAGAHGMAGGWGFPVGDEGSGAWLGARLLRRYLWHRDGFTSESSLMAMLDERLGGSVSEVQRARPPTLARRRMRGSHDSSSRRRSRGTRSRRRCSTKGESAVRGSSSVRRPGCRCTSSAGSPRPMLHGSPPASVHACRRLAATRSTDSG